LLAKLAEGTGAKVSVVEMPPGPPVLQSVVAEIHGPTPEIRRQFTRDMTEFFAQAKSARDVDNYLRDAYDYWRFDVDTEKAVRRGISVDTINRNLAMALGGAPIGDVKQKAGHEPVQIALQVPLSERSQIDRLGDLPVQSNGGFTVPLRELGSFQRVPEEDIIYNKDLRPIEFVVADVGGKLAAPIYAMFQIQDEMDASGYVAPDGVVPSAYWIGPPPNDSHSAWEWSGEWTVTYETFRDMGAAFMVALVLIYILVVWEFGNFRIPLVIMAPIPLTLLGIIPAHLIMFNLGLGGEFTATSMIGWIALAGIIVRNSILLVDFSIHEVQKGVPVAESVIRACKTRTRPIVITALALVAGSSVIFTDPIFQGMAISLASGVLVSTLLTLVVIPLGCVAASKDLCEVAAATAPAGGSVPCAAVEAKKVQKAKKESKGSALVTVWGYVVEGITLVFYLIRGIFLLLFDLLKGLVKKKKPVAKPTRPAAGSAGGGSSGATPAVAPASRTGDEPTVMPGNTAPATTGAREQGATAGNTDERQGEVAITKGQPDSPVPEQDVGSAAPEAEVTAPVSDEVVAASVEPVTPVLEADISEPAPDEPPQAVADEPAGEQAVAMEDRGKAGADGTSAKASVEKKDVKKKGPARKRETKKVTAKSSGTEKQTLVQKKAQRRGIRLKVDEGKGPGFE
jgi:hypothetical protein